MESHFQAGAEEHSLQIEEYLLQVLASDIGNKEEQRETLSVPAESQSDYVDRALGFYRKQLRARLEPQHIGDHVAIHPDTGDYEVARGMGHSIRALRVRQPKGQIVVHKIGVADEGLRARMRGERRA